MSPRIVSFITGILLSLNLTAQTTLYVGTGGGEYSTIASAYAACTSAGTHYIIEVKSTYANSEAKPITFASNVAGSIIIRPHSSIVAVLTITTGTAASVFSFTAGDNITIDGRVGSTGSTSLFTIENTQAASSKYAIQFSGGSTYNTIKYCTVKGSNTSSTASSTSPGVIMFASGTNNYNTIDNCTIRESASGNPLVGVYSYDATNNNLLTISNTNFVNMEYRHIWADGNNNTDWTISGNSFYQTATQTGGSGNMIFIYMEHGTGYTISGNYFGGQAAQCGGSAFTFTGDDMLNCIFFDQSNSGTITVSNNTIKNIAYTTTLGAGNHWCPIDTWGSSNFVISGNTIGSTSGTDNITVTDNGSSSTAYEFVLGEFSATGTTTYSNNVVGAITFNGSNTTNKRYYLAFIDNGTNNFSTGNIFGNTTANNMKFLGTGSGQYGLRNTGSGQFTVNETIFRNFYLAGSQNFNCVNSQGSVLSCTNNTMYNLTSDSDTYNYSVYHLVNAAATITGNTIYDISLTGSAITQLFFIEASGGAVTCSSNTIGEFGTTNDISIASNTNNYIFYFGSASTLTASSNVVQNVYLSSTGSSNEFEAISIQSGVSSTTTISENGIDNITSEINSNSSREAIRGINHSGAGAATFRHNTMSDFIVNTTGTEKVNVAGIYINSAASSVTINRNKITGLINKSTVAATTAAIRGIYVLNTGVSANIYNNIVLIDNGSNTNDILIYGIYSVNTSTNNIYHNTVKIFGSISSGSQYAYSLYINVGSGTYNIRNNNFQQLRTGGSANFYAIANANTGNTFVEDYNYLENTTSSKVGLWSATNKTFAAWNTSSGATNNKNGTITIAGDGSVPAATTTDVKTNGTNLSATVSDDFDGNARASTPWRGAYEIAIPLPVELVEFKEVCRQDGTHIFWSTQTEINNDYFILEYCDDSLNWEEIARIKGQGNSVSLNQYEFLHKNINPRRNYYRLTQVDYDGRTEVFPIITSQCDKDMEDILVYPNPFESAIKIDVQHKTGNKLSLVLCDTNGKMLMGFEWTGDEIDQNPQMIINTDYLPAGTYILQVSNGTNLKGYKMVKLTE